MYKYEEPSMFSGKRGLALLFVILLHIVIGYGFYTGLAQHIIAHVIPPVEIAEIDKPKQEDKPPPPPPKMEEIKPYVPPPEFVDIQAPQETNAPVAVAVNNTPAPAAPPAPPAPVVQHSRTSIKMDPKHPLKIGDDFYPDASRRANEEGTCRVKITVAADGRITDASIEASSGFPRLDEACLKGVRGQRVLPATEDGKPVELTTIVPITWKLKN
jgi:protein TonB